MNKKYKISSSVMVIIAIAILIAVNAFVTALTGKFPIKLDMTPNKIYSISDSTKEYLKSYKTPTEIFVMASEAEEDETIKSVLDKYAAACSNIKITNIDPKTNPTFGSKYMKDNQSLSNTYVIVDGGDRFKTFAMSDLYNVSNTQSGRSQATSIKAEEKITSALKYVSSTATVNAYIVNGHNEANTSNVKTALENESYTVKDLNLVTEEIPQDASLLVVLDPSTDFTVAETAKLDNYFANGGHAQFYFDATVSDGLTNLFAYLEKWGIQVNDKVAVEQGKNNMISLGGNMSIMIADMESDDITSALSKNKRYVAYLPYAKTLTKLFDNSNNISVKPLLSTSSSAYSSEDYENLQKKDSDETGTFNIGILATNSQNKSSVYVSGSSMLLNYSQEEIAQSFGFANYDYFFNVCSYMKGDTDDYTVSAKSLSVETITIKPIMVLILAIIFVALVPVIALVSGIVVWFKRRHL